MTAQRALVTGGEGFIGANLARRLAEEGWDVHVLSRPNPARRWKLLDLLGAAARVHPVDLLDRSGLATTLAAVRPHAVFHLAGRVDLERSAEVARLCVDENVRATVNLLDAVQALPVESVVYASTTEVYGSGPPPFREDAPADPPSPYSASKLAGEAFCHVWARTFGVPVRILRMSSAYGPGQPVERLVPSVILAALRGAPVGLRSPRHRREFVFVADIVDGIVRAARDGLAAGEVLNLGSAEAVAVEDVARAILAEMRVSSPPAAAGTPRRNEAPCLMTDSSKARALLGWAPGVPLGEGLARTIAWYRGLAERGQIPG